METGAGYLCGCLGIENSKLLAKIPVSLGLKIKRARLAPAADLNVVANQSILKIKPVNPARKSTLSINWKD